MLEIDASSWLFYAKLITMYGHLNIKYLQCCPFERTQLRLWSFGTEAALHLYSLIAKRREYYETCVKFYVPVDVYLQPIDSHNGIKQTQSNKVNC